MEHEHCSGTRASRILPMSTACRSHLIFKQGYSVPVLIDDAQIGHVAVKEILP